MLIQKTIAFVKRDFFIDSSYKFAFVLELLATVFPILSFYFVGKLIHARTVESLSRYGGEYFPFVMIGIALTQYFMLALRTFAGTIRRGQMAGCLEAMLSTATRPETTIILSSLYAFLSKMFHIIVVFGISGLFLGVSYSRSDFLSAGVILFLTISTFSSLGILSAAIIIVLKKGDPIEWIFGSLSSLLGGALFPIDVMPPWMQNVAMLLPMTYSLDAMRLAVLEGYSLPMLWRQATILSAMAVVLFPLSLVCFSRAIEKGRCDGSLMHY